MCAVDKHIKASKPQLEEALTTNFSHKATGKRQKKLERNCNLPEVSCSRHCHCAVADGSALGGNICLSPLLLRLLPSAATQEKFADWKCCQLCSRRTYYLLFNQINYKPWLLLFQEMMLEDKISQRTTCTSIFLP